MTDLVTRLRALHDRMERGLSVTDLSPVREAADALEHESICREDFVAEHEALKAKLAEAEARAERTQGALHDMNDAWCEMRSRAKKAEAEAAALREAFSPYADVTGSYVWGQDDCDSIKEVLSQPGPGAALLDEVKRLRAKNGK